MARFGNPLRNGFPQRIDQLLHLLAVGVRHLGQNIGLHGTLVLADRRAEDFGLEVQLVEQPLIEHQRRRKPRPVHTALRLEIDAVGGRSQVVLALRIDFVVRDHELAALLEVDHRGAQFLQDGRARNSASAVEPQVDTLDAVVVLGGFDGPQRLDKRKLLGRSHCHPVDGGKGIGRRRIDDLFGQVDFENRPRTNRYGTSVQRRSHAGNHSEQKNPEKQREERTHQKGKHPGQKCFEEIHTYIYLSLLCGSVVCKDNHIFRETNKIYRFSIKYNIHSSTPVKQ